MNRSEGFSLVFFKTLLLLFCFHGPSTCGEQLLRLIDGQAELYYPPADVWIRVPELDGATSATTLRVPSGKRGNPRDLFQTTVAAGFQGSDAVHVWNPVVHTFQFDSPPSQMYAQLHVSAGDFGKDGIDELLCNYVMRMVYFFDVTTETWTHMGGLAMNLEAFDVNGDGWRDLVYGFGGISNGILVQWNDGTGPVSAPIDPVHSESGDLAVGDLSGDGVDDLIVSTGDWFRYLDGDSLTWQEMGPTPAARPGVLGARVLSCGDLDEDGQVEAVLNTISGVFVFDEGVWEYFAEAADFVVVGDFEVLLAREIAIPDPVFKSFLVESYDIDGDGEISRKEAATPISLLCARLPIGSVSGLEWFVNLRDISFYQTEITTLPDLTGLKRLEELVVAHCFLSQLPELDQYENLRRLSVGYNHLLELPSLPESLEYLSCSGNDLVSLPDLSELTQLQYLGCSDNQITQLPDLSYHSQLEELYCARNPLFMLPSFDGNPNLKVIHCASNQLQSLPDLTGLVFLEKLICNHNQLTELPDLSGLINLRRLICWANYLEDLPGVESCVSLRRLYCFDNDLTQLPDLSQMFFLEYLDCSNNPLVTLPDLSNCPLLRLYCSFCGLIELPPMNTSSLERLYCRGNSLVELPDLAGAPNLVELEASENQLTIVPNVWDTQTTPTFVNLRWNNFTENDCPDIQQIIDMGVTDFFYNPQNGGYICQ